MGEIDMGILAGDRPHPGGALHVDPAAPLGRSAGTEEIPEVQNEGEGSGAGNPANGPTGQHGETGGEEALLQGIRALRPLFRGLDDASPSGEEDMGDDTQRDDPEEDGMDVEEPGEEVLTPEL